MSTAQTTASPRAPRGKPQSPAPAHSNNAGRQSHRKPRGNRAQNGSHHQHAAAGASPSKMPVTADPALAESETAAPAPAPAPRNTKKHTHAQPSVDRVVSPAGAQAAVAHSEPVPINPSATPAKIQGAYAGPTFHASPAPSALPIPKFLSRSVPAKARAGPPTPPPEESSGSASSSPSPASPSRVPVAIPSRNEQSPLDVLFKADKAERAKNNHGPPVPHSFFSPAYARPQQFKQDTYQSLNAPFPIELDGENNHARMSPPHAGSPASRSVTDPTKVPQLKDVYQQSNGHDVMQDLFNRLSMSQKKPASATPPTHNGQAPFVSQSPHHSPSPFHDGRPLVRSTSGPTTPQAQPPSQDSADFFYGNKNLSPLFQAAKGDSAKRNSGLRTEISPESPSARQGAFQGFSSISPPHVMDPNTFTRGQAGNGNEGPANVRRDPPPFAQPYQQSPNNRRKTPGRQQHQNRGNFHGPTSRPGNTAAGAPSTSAPKPATSMMSFVPASVAAKQHKNSTPTATGAPPPRKTSAPSETMALEQDLKRLLNLKPAGDTPGVV